MSAHSSKLQLSTRTAARAGTSGISRHCCPSKLGTGKGTGKAWGNVPFPAPGIRGGGCTGTVQPHSPTPGHLQEHHQTHLQATASCGSGACSVFCSCISNSVGNTPVAPWPSLPEVLLVSSWNTSLVTACSL